MGGDDLEHSLLPRPVIEQNEELDSKKWHDRHPLLSWCNRDENELHCWKSKRWELWQSREVLAWISDVARISDHIDFKLLHSERFNKKTGIDLNKMNQAAFEQLEPKYGAQIYSVFRKLVNESPILSASNSSSTICHKDFSSAVNLATDIDELTDIFNFSNDQQFGGQHIPFGGHATYHSVPSHTPPQHSPDHISHQHSPDHISHQHSPDHISHQHTPDYIGLPHHYTPPHHHDCDRSTLCTCRNGYPYETDSKQWKHASQLIIDETTRSMPISKRGRPRKRGGVSGTGSRVQKPNVERKHGAKGSHLWEFVLELLLDRKYNPSHIQWECQDEGIFRIVKSNAVAQMWGERKKNSTMTYEKLSRAMRHYYKNDILIPVAGRRLVYQFGPCSSGWQHADDKTSHALHRLDDVIRLSMCDYT